VQFFVPARPAVNRAAPRRFGAGAGDRGSGMIRCGGGEDPAGCRLRADSDHNPGKGVAKDFLPNDGVKERHRLAAWFYKVNDNVAVAWPQHSRRNFDNSRKVGRIANRPDAFRPVPHIHPEMLCSAERARQRLALWQSKGAALHNH